MKFRAFVCVGYRSHLPTSVDSLYFHPVVAHGVGVWYQVLDEHIHFTVTTDGTHPPRGTDGAGLREELLRTMRELARAFLPERGEPRPKM